MPRAAWRAARRCEVDGPAWQVMRLSRNRNWGHPDLVALVERLAVEAKEKDGWNGLLVGDLAQPRGGPMLSGHASHQVGLDADVWLTPMPDRTLTPQGARGDPGQAGGEGPQAHRSRGVDREAMRGSSSAPRPIRRWRASSSIRRSRRSSANGPRATGPGWPRSAPISGTTITSTSASTARRTRPTARTSPSRAPKDGTGCGDELAYWMGDKPWPKPREARRQAAEARETRPALDYLAALPAECRAVVTAE